MPKEKVLKEIEPKEYFKEILSFILIAFSFIALGKLGTLGKYLFLIIDIIFGDWCFILILLTLFFCIRYLFKGDAVDFHNIRLHGFIIIYLTLSVLSHFSFYDSLEASNTTILTKTIQVYKCYFKNFESTYLTGGGFIGALLFQIIIFLVGKTGIIILSILFILMGISYLLNYSLSDFLGRFKNIRYALDKIKNKIIVFLQHFSLFKTTKIVIKKNKISLTDLETINTKSNRLIQEDINKEKELLIQNLIIQKKLPITYCEYHTGDSSTTFRFKVNGHLSKEMDVLLELFEFKCFYIYENQNLDIEVVNKFKELTTLRKVLEGLGQDNAFMVLGMDNREDLIVYDNKGPLWLVGERDSGIRSYLRCFLIYLILNYKRSFKAYLLDINKEFKELIHYNNEIEAVQSVEDINKVIENLVIEYDKRIEVLKYLECDNFLDANNKIKETNKNISSIVPTFCIINFSLSLLPNISVQKLDYLVKLSSKVGIHFIIVSRKKEDSRIINIKQMTKMIFKVSDLSFSIDLLNSDLACLLNGRGDFVLNEQNKISHGQTPYLSMTDYLKILNKFIF